MRDCGCDDCRRRREEAEDAAFADGVVFAVYWHELHEGFPWQTHGHDAAGHGAHGVHDHELDDHEVIDDDLMLDGFDDPGGW